MNHYADAVIKRMLLRRLRLSITSMVISMIIDE